MISPQTRQTLAGIGLAVCIILAVLASLPGWIAGVYAGAAAWLAGVLLWADVPRRIRVQSGILLLVGVLGMGAGVVGVGPGTAIRVGDLPWQDAIAINAKLIAMLAAVSFLRLITAPPDPSVARVPTGRRSLAGTLAGVHLFGAVVNLSTVFIMARRMSSEDRLSRQQYVALVRGFGTAAFWSPFFAAMAAALTYAPGARLPALLAFGLPLALLSLLLTYRDVSRLGAEDFRGYPLNVSSLWLPALLAALILAAHGWRADLSILGLIALLAPSVTVVTLAVRRRSVVNEVTVHFRRGLPAMKGELVLFLSAGVMATGLTVLMAVTELSLPMQDFGGREAALLLAALVAAAIVGVHPVIGVAAAAPLVAPLNPDPSLLASVFLAAWGIGVSASPLSAMNLAIQGSYGIRPGQVLKWNLPFAVATLLIAATMLLAHPAG
ncbi:hypothetical protein GJ672_09410 [Spiribacter sp. 2438]|uniref:hypothetical protein n=1 Tax=Spiribacter sp. 2438 TaxID=2666185 RepID=UPI0012AEF5CC|nr:hypothetical protein [Spiribacter sp. 2438]QGM22442.1 hypothetical protein GJ672_09410 [Spiribacter sp. 2438]